MRHGHVAAMAGTALIALLAHRAPTPALVWNASASAPLGLYVVHKVQSLARGDLVVAWPPDGATTMAAQRGYLPRGVPIVKHVAALLGDEVCSVGETITIDGRRAAQRLAADKEGRALPAWRGCVRLDGDHVFLLTASILDSFDGRYFGPIRRDTIIGKATPLWLW